MKTSPFKKTALLGISFLILLVLVVFFFNEGARRDRLSKGSNDAVYSESLLNKAEKIILSSGEESVELENVNGTWSVFSMSTDQDVLDVFLTTLADFPRGNEVSTNPANWNQYGVDMESSRRVNVVVDGEDSTIFVGRPAGGGSVYVRYSGNDSVYRAKSSLVSQLRFDVNSWRDKKIFSVEDQQVEQVSARVGEERWSFLLRENGWVQVDETGETLIDDQDAFESYLSQLLSYKANGFEADVSKFVDADNALSIQVKGGDEVVLSIDNTDEEGIFAKLTGMEELFKLSSDMSVLLRPGFLELNESEEQ